MGKKKGKKRNKAGGRGGGSAVSKSSAAIPDTPKIDQPSTEIVNVDDASVEITEDKNKPHGEVDITKESVQTNEATCVDAAVVNNETTNLNDINEYSRDKAGYSDANINEVAAVVEGANNNNIVAPVEDIAVDETVLPSTNETDINNTNETNISTNEADINTNSIASNESVSSDVEKEPDQIDGEESSEEVEKMKEVGSIEIDNDLNSSSQSISTIPSPGIAKDKDSRKTLEPYESFSDGDSTSPSRSLRTQSSRLNSQELEEVDLDSSIDTKVTETSAPLVRAYNGTLNGISPASNNSLSFTFKDSTESEAFAFLTKSLRESLGEDAKDVSDDALSRYIRYKPDVKRATDRFRAYQAFQKENSYFGDKPLLLSQDPKLMFLAQNGFVIAPEELFAKDGSGVMIIKGAKCEVGSPHGCDDQDASRAIFYILQRMMDRSTLDPMKGITIILDLSGSVRKNLPKKLSILLSKAVGCIPVRIKAIHVLSMPWWFPAAGTKKLFTIKMRQRIHILKNKVELHENIEKDRLLEEYGGIYGFDLQAWISSTVLNEVEGIRSS